MNCFYNGPHGECSEQMYKLYQHTDGDYEPTNCRWVPMSIQLRNRRAMGKKLAGDAE